MNLKNLKTKVLYVLSTEPKTRNSDITLTIVLWKHYYPEYMIQGKTGEDYVKVASLFDLPREDHIKRVRAQIQNVEQRYLPTELSVFVERARASEEWRKQLGYQDYWNLTDWNRVVRTYMEEKEPIKYSEKGQGVLI